MLSTTQPSTGTLGAQGHFLVPGTLQGEQAWCFSAWQKKLHHLFHSLRECLWLRHELELLDNTAQMFTPVLLGNLQVPRATEDEARLVLLPLRQLCCHCTPCFPPGHLSQ